MEKPTKETRYFFLRFLRKYTVHICVILGVCAMSPVIGYLGKWIPFPKDEEEEKNMKFVIALFIFLSRKLGSIFLLWEIR